MGWFFQGPLIGPLIGPVIGGYLNQWFGWQSIFYFLGVMGLVFVILVVFFLPETHPMTRRRIVMAKIRKDDPNFVPDSFWTRLHATFVGFNPLKPVVLLRHPAVVITVAYLSVIIASLYVVSTTIPVDFTAIYPGISTGTLGLLYLGGGLGNVVGAIVGGRIVDYWRKRQLQNEKQRLERQSDGDSDDVQVTIPPEQRLGPASIGAVLIPIGYLGYGWFMQANYNGAQLSLFIPLAFLFIVGFGNLFVLTACSTFLVDAFPENSAAAISLNNMARSILGAAATLIAVPWEQALGVGWVMTIIAIINVIMSLSLIVIHVKGRSWYEKRMLMPNQGGF